MKEGGISLAPGQILSLKLFLHLLKGLSQADLGDGEPGARDCAWPIDTQSMMVIIILIHTIAQGCESAAGEGAGSRRGGVEPGLRLGQGYSCAAAGGLQSQPGGDNKIWSCVGLPPPPRLF